MRQILFFISVALLGIGIYLKFFYDVPDADQAINFFTGWFFIIIGIASLLINLFWSSSKKTK
jgi:hypothetical protein